MTKEIRTDIEAATFARQKLRELYARSARVFPWRGERDSFRVLMAEMMLRRTRADQVVDVYRRFIDKYPDAATLDQASAEEVAEILRPLGLYWRAANFKKLARELMTSHSGQVPEDRDALLALTGVGPYVADAVRCFAFGKYEVLADTNTVRVAARYFGFDYNPESRRRPAVVRAVSELIDTHNPEISNYALLDFAATVCRARDPVHDVCPLRGFCAYYQQLTPDQSGDSTADTDLTITRDEENYNYE